MDEETKRLAKQKADAINERIGYPDVLTKSDELEAEFQQVFGKTKRTRTRKLMYRI
jgi:membrane metallo-endopeptidase-like protein 1